MWHAFKYTLLSSIRDRSTVIWVILFPLILATLFNVMFTGIDDTTMDIIPVAIVDQSENEAGVTFNETMDAIADEDDPLISIVRVDSSQEALDLMNSGEVIGTITLDAEGTPSLEVSPCEGSMGLSMEQIQRMVLADIVDSYCQSAAAVRDIAENDPEALMNPDVIASFAERAEFCAETTITHNKAGEFVRYFYALLGFAAFMAATVGLNAVGRIQPNLSSLGARRVVGGTSRGRMLAGAIAASWILSFCCLLLAFAYIRFGLGVSFGGREGACIVGLVVASLMATSFGAAIGALPRIPFQLKGGVLTGINCLLSLFAGLYGTFSLRLADQVARETPWTAAINPVKQVTDLFYSLYVYNDLGPFFGSLGTLLVISAVFALVAALFMRRQRYASL